MSDKTLISQSIIANEIALDFNEKIKHTNYYKTVLKNKLNNLQKELIQLEKKEFDVFFDKQEGATSHLYKSHQDLVTEITSLGLEHYECLVYLIQAYKKDQNKANELVNEILTK
jgi:hypothetical protein